MHKFKAIRGNHWMQMFIDMISCLRRNDIHCVFIFDGKAPKEKETEREKRKNEEKIRSKLNVLNLPSIHIIKRVLLINVL